MHHALIRTQPPELRVPCQLPRERHPIRRDRLQRPPLDEPRQKLRRQHHQVRTTPQRKRQSKSTHTRIRFQNAVGRRVIRILVHRIRADILFRGRKPDIQHLYLGDIHVAISPSIHHGRRADKTTFDGAGDVASSSLHNPRTGWHEMIGCVRLAVRRDKRKIPS